MAPAGPFASPFGGSSTRSGLTSARAIAAIFAPSPAGCRTILARRGKTAGSPRRSVFRKPRSWRPRGRAAHAGRRRRKAAPGRQPSCGGAAVAGQRYSRPASAIARRCGPPPGPRRSLDRLLPHLAARERRGLGGCRNCRAATDKTASARGRRARRSPSWSAPGRSWRKPPRPAPTVTEPSALDSSTLPSSTVQRGGGRRRPSLVQSVPRMAAAAAGLDDQTLAARSARAQMLPLVRLNSESAPGLISLTTMMVAGRADLGVVGEQHREAAQRAGAQLVAGQQVSGGCRRRASC